MISTRKDWLDPTVYVTLTWPAFRIFKVDGQWYYRNKNSENSFGPFVQKKVVIQDIENRFNPSPTWEGMKRNQYATRLDNCEAILIKNTGHGINYWKEFIDSTAKKIWNWCCWFYDIDINVELNVQQTYSDNVRIRASFANGYRVKIRPVYELVRNRDGYFFVREYNHIAKDPDIGEFYTADPHKLIVRILLHEIAHSVQSCIGGISNFTKFYNVKDMILCKGKEYNRKWHDKDWQTIYHKLCTEFLPECTGMSEEIPRIVD